MKELEYPFDNDFILKKKKSLKKQLLEENETKFLEKNIAILGGSTTNDIKLTLELFLLDSGVLSWFWTGFCTCGFLFGFWFSGDWLFISSFGGFLNHLST